VRPTAARPTTPFRLLLAATLTIAAGSLTACGGGSGGGPDTVKISFKQSTDNSIKVMDTFLADITSGYLKPLDSYLAKWPDWNQFIDTAKTAAKAEDGKTYGVPDGFALGGAVKG
jgi:multiple sugar transport system substrate-binding protein